MIYRGHDPAEWNEASYIDDPIDHLEPAESAASEYRKASLAMLVVLRAVDQFMTTGSPPKKWYAVALALGLPSVAGTTETAVAEELGVCRAAVSKQVVTVLRLANMEQSPSFGLKSFKARQTFRETNGRPRSDSAAEGGTEASIGDFPAA
jgi:hypothetical protein